MRKLRRGREENEEIKGEIEREENEETKKRGRVNGGERESGKEREKEENDEIKEEREKEKNEETERELLKLPKLCLRGKQQQVARTYDPRPHLTPTH